MVGSQSSGLPRAESPGQTSEEVERAVFAETVKQIVRKADNWATKAAEQDDDDMYMFWIGYREALKDVLRTFAMEEE